MYTFSLVWLQRCRGMWYEQKYIDKAPWGKIIFLFKYLKNTRDYACPTFMQKLGHLLNTHYGYTLNLYSNSPYWISVPGHLCLKIAERSHSKTNSRYQTFAADTDSFLLVSRQVLRLCFNSVRYLKWHAERQIQSVTSLRTCIAASTTSGRCSCWVTSLRTCIAASTTSGRCSCWVTSLRTCITASTTSGRSSCLLPRLVDPTCITAFTTSGVSHVDYAIIWNPNGSPIGNTKSIENIQRRFSKWCVLNPD